MAIELIATVGAENANSYVTIEEADEIIQLNMFLSVYWDVAELNSQKSVLVLASRILDEQIHWFGLPTEEEQALAWPRTVTWTRNGDSIEEDVIPRFLKIATSELGCHLLQKNRMTDPLTMGYKSMKVDTLQLEIDKTYNQSVLPDSIWQIVKYYGDKNDVSQPILHRR